MATQPDPAPDTVEPQSPSETPELPGYPMPSQPNELPGVIPDNDEPSRGPMEIPPPPD